jgi:hypothetical protein
MVCHLLEKFLEDRAEYAGAVDYWVGLWEKVEPSWRERTGWQQPWLFSGWQEHPEFMDGNPMFSAWSPQERKGIRVIQYAPTSEDLEFDFWLDTFGGAPGDPDSIQTLVIACALSDEAAQLALEEIGRWVRGTIDIDYPVVLVRKGGVAFRYTAPAPVLPMPELELASV